MPSACSGVCGRGGGWRLLSRPFPGTTLRTLPPPAVPGPWHCKNKNIPLMSVHLCDPPSVPRPFPLSCSPPLSAARINVAPRYHSRGCRGHHGAAHGWTPPSTSCVPGAGAGEEKMLGCLRKLLQGVFPTPRGDLGDHCLGWAARPWGDAWQCSGSRDPAHLVTQCHYAKAAIGSSAWSEAMALSRAQPPLGPPHALLRGDGSRTGLWGAAPMALPCCCVLGGVILAGGKAEHPILRQQALWAAVSTRQRLAGAVGCC